MMSSLRARIHHSAYFGSINVAANVLNKGRRQTKKTDSGRFALRGPRLCASERHARQIRAPSSGSFSGGSFAAPSAAAPPQLEIFWRPRRTEPISQSWLKTSNQMRGSSEFVSTRSVLVTRLGFRAEGGADSCAYRASLGCGDCIDNQSH